MFLVVPRNKWPAPAPRIGSAQPSPRPHHGRPIIGSFAPLFAVRVYEPEFLFRVSGVAMRYEGKNLLFRTPKITDIPISADILKHHIL